MLNLEYYKTLRVSPDASAEEIKKAYRTLAMETHPDRNPHDVRAEKRFVKINEAYCVLSDPGRRLQYDKDCHVGQQTGRSHGSGFGHSPNKTFRDFFTGRHDTNKPKNWMSGAQGVSIIVPFKIEAGLVVQSEKNKRLIARSRIIGALRGEFIMITEPTVQLSDRFSTVINENMQCFYLNKSGLYSFRSRYRKKLINDVICIEYPQKVQVRERRRDRRIKVNIEARFFLSDYVDLFYGVVTDISASGCRLTFKQRASISDGAEAVVTLRLPNEVLESKLEAKVLNVAHITKNKTTALGLSFTGPPDELSKVANFCEFCMIFELGS